MFSKGKGSGGLEGPWNTRGSAEGEEREIPFPGLLIIPRDFPSIILFDVFVWESRISYTMYTCVYLLVYMHVYVETISSWNGKNKEYVFNENERKE